ncbi:hypothetical protein ACFP3T_08640 [Lactiplantibacillus dongliensis]|uniref:Phage abortive infection protein n=1 Tax=Lactiplantibacillus dongliensis TaxID=2559919 RepID=A0ABW1R7A9_9LACO|nr:hypothetical protein [Lactiplantibacillus dongliensis]
MAQIWGQVRKRMMRGSKFRLWFLGLGVVLVILGLIGIDNAVAMIWLNTLVSIATIMGIVIALVQFQWTNRNRQEDLNNKRFDYTKQALDYYVHEIIPLLDYDLAAFDAKMKVEMAKYMSHYNANNRELLEYLVISDLLTKFDPDINDFIENQVNLMGRLSRLSGYFYFDKVNQKQVLSIIGYRVQGYYKHRGIIASFSLLQERTHINNYLTVLVAVGQYVNTRS